MTGFLEDVLINKNNSLQFISKTRLFNRLLAYKVIEIQVAMFIEATLNKS